MRRAWLVLLVGLVLVAGCLGEGETEESQLDQTATVTEDAGGIQGVVTNAAVEAIADAEVTLVETGATTTTAMDGSFAFSEVSPGDYTIRANAEGYLGTERNLTVNAASVETIDIVLAEVPEETPYQHTIEMEGFIECGLGWRQTVAQPGQPLIEDSAIAACAVPNLYIPGNNATNDRFLHIFQMDPPLTEAVYEMEWEGDGPDATTPTLRSILELNGFVNNASARIMDVRGQSPITLELTEEDWEGLEGNITHHCEEDEGDGWCDVNPRTDGWEMMLRVFATGDCFDTPASACAVFQQPFTHYVSAFYHQQAPDGFSVFDNA